MKTHHFTLKEDGNIYVIPEMPEKLRHYCAGKPDCCRGLRCSILAYDEALSLAKESAILVENQEEVIWKAVHSVPHVEDSFEPFEFIVGELYPLESGIEVKYELYIPTQDRWSGCSEDNYLSAINNGRKAREVALITFSEPKPSEEQVERQEKKPKSILEEAMDNIKKHHRLFPEPEHECEFSLLQNVAVHVCDCGNILLDNEKEYTEVKSSPAHTDNQEEPTQEELWKEVIDSFYYCNSNEQYRLAEEAVKMKYTITQKTP